MILGVLAMPSTIYAKVFRLKKAFTSVTGCGVKQAIFTPVEIKDFSDIKVGMKFIAPNFKEPKAPDDLWSVFEIPTEDFEYNGSKCHPYKKLLAKSYTVKGVQLFCFNCPDFDFGKKIPWKFFNHDGWRDA